MKTFRTRPLTTHLLDSPCDFGRVHYGPCYYDHEDYSFFGDWWITKMHFKEVCKHGRVVRQCRCPGPKSVRTVECPEYCHEYSKESRPEA